MLCLLGKTINEVNNYSELSTMITIQRRFHYSIIKRNIHGVTKRQGDNYVYVHYGIYAVNCLSTGKGAVEVNKKAANKMQ